MTDLPSDVSAFLDTVQNKTRRANAVELIDIYRRVTGLEPILWGTMIGFDAYDYRYDTGHEGRSFLAGFAPRKAQTVVYLTSGTEHYPETLAKLGKHRASVVCLYINKLADVDLAVLEDVIGQSYRDMKARNHIKS